MTKRKRPNPQRATAARSRLPLLLAAGFVGLVTIVAGFWLIRGSSAEPVDITSDTGRLEARQTTIDLGRVPLNKQEIAEFELVNSGATPVRLLGQPEVATLAGC